MGITNEELFEMTSKDLNRLLKQKGIPDSLRRDIRKHRRSRLSNVENCQKVVKNRKNRQRNRNTENHQHQNKINSDNDLRSQIEELKRLGHLQKLRIEEEIKRCFQLKQKLEALEEDKICKNKKEII